MAGPAVPARDLYASSDTSEDEDPPPPRPWIRDSPVELDANGLWFENIPEWTNPDHPSVDPGYYTPFNRPPLLPEDAADRPTREALRFGIHPDATPAAGGEGRSMMTPIVASSNSPSAAAANNIDVELEMAYQAMVLEGFTTSEMAAAGAYRPDNAFPGPDLTGGLHPMLVRDKWDQGAFEGYDPMQGLFTTPAGSTEEHPVLRYDIRGKRGDFDVSTNDELWAVMQPSLRLVTKILAMHPVWNALLNIYHLKPLPESADSRTQEQRKKEGGRVRATFWLAEQKEEDMYPGARTIHSSSFPWTKDIIEDYLTQILVLGFKGVAIVQGEDGDAPEHIVGVTTLHYDDGVAKPFFPRINVRLSADLVWPLLIDDISTGEKVGVSVRLAATLLHELGHAAADAVRLATIFPQHLRGPTGIPLVQWMQDALRQMGKDFGCEWNAATNRVVGEVVPRADWFFEDGVEPEEGFAVENQVFGGLMMGASPYLSDKNCLLHPYGPGILKSWPTPPPDLRVNTWEGKFAYGMYSIWNKSPPPPTFATRIPVAQTDVNQYLQQAFWDDSVAKYGAPGLRQKSTNNLTKMTLEFRGPNNFAEEFSRAFQSREAAQHILAGLRYLKTNGAPLCGEYLTHVTIAATEARRFKMHLHYTKKTWRRIDDAIRALDTQVVASIARLRREMWYVTAADVHNYFGRFNGMVGNLLELVRVLQQECFHSQFLVFGFLQRSMADRVELGTTFLNDLLQRWTTVLGPILEWVIRNVLAWPDPSNTVGMTPAASGLPQEALDMLPDVAAAIQQLQPVFATIRAHVVYLCQAIQATERGDEIDIDAFQEGVFTVLPFFSRETHQAFRLKRLAIEELSRTTDETMLGALKGLLSSLATIKEVRPTAEYFALAAERVRVGRANLLAGLAIFGAPQP